jgi:hypothetical protein
LDMDAGMGDVDGSSSLMVGDMMAAECGCWSRVDDDKDKDIGMSGDGDCDGDSDGFMDDECRLGVG